jgi:hypothetical protein
LSGLGELLADFTMKEKFTMTRLFALAFFSIFAAGSCAAQAAVCEVSDQMTREQKLPCVRAAKIMLEQRSLSPAQLANGPDFDAADPAKSRFAYFTEADNIFCYFRPHYAFMAIKGDSLKFQCWHMTSDGAFFNTHGEPVRFDSVKVVIDKKKGGEQSASLFASNDDSNEHEIKADHFKVKYLKPPFPNHNIRFNEVFTEVAASRIMWVLGFPSDHVYPVGSASCIGCGPDPFTNDFADNKASLKDAPAVFKVVSAEREAPWDAIKPGGDETWSWTDAARFYSDGSWTHQQKVEYDAYRLALGLLHYHNAIAQQNRVVCAEWGPKVSGQPRICKQSMLFVQDLGSTFGKAKGFLDIFGTNPRGSFSAWEPQTVFTNPQSCELRATLEGDKQVLKEAQDLMIQRLSRLDAATIKTIFRTARFQLMDQNQLRKLREKGSANPEEGALDQWTNTFLKRIEEIRSAQHCKAN